MLSWISKVVFRINKIVKLLELLMAHYLIADKSWKLWGMSHAAWLWDDYEAGCNINRKAFLRHIPRWYAYVNAISYGPCFVSSVSIIRVLNGVQCKPYMRYINGIYVSLFIKPGCSLSLCDGALKVEKISFDKEHLVMFSLSGLSIGFRDSLIIGGPTSCWQQSHCTHGSACDECLWRRLWM